MNMGSGPIFSIYMGVPINSTISASMGGTAAAVQILNASAAKVFNNSSAGGMYARSMEVFNLTGRNLELVVGVNDIGVTAYQTASFIGVGTANVTYGSNGQFFVPGTATSTVAGRANRFAIATEGGFSMWVRTTENTPITCTSTNPLIINFWA